MIGGRYELDRELARGGMGAVWLGTDVVLGRQVAIKRVGVSPSGSSPDLLRAEREARIAASLSHPHIVGVYDLVHERDQQWLVMEYVEGATLAELVRTRGPLPASEVADVLAQAASALKAAHAAGIVHRDVKPSNILMRPDGEAKLSDFGIARAEADASLTQTGLVTGSPAYLAPEVASGQLAGPSADVWSLGATLFHALSGHPPYDVGDNVLGALYRIVHEAPPRLETAGELSPLLEATMVVDPAARWSMAEVERFLRDVAAGRVATRTELQVTPGGAGAAYPGSAFGPTGVLPVAALQDVEPVGPAPSHPGGTRRGERRNRALPAAIVVVLVALVAAVALLVLGGGDDEDPAARPVSPSASTTPSGSGAPDSPTPTAGSAPDAVDMQQFARDYVATATADPTEGYRLLTPEYGRASGGLSGYRDGFWGNVESAQIVGGPVADTDALTVQYTYRYELSDGSTRQERVLLRLAFDPADGSYLISGAGTT